MSVFYERKPCCAAHDWPSDSTMLDCGYAGKSPGLKLDEVKGERRKSKWLWTRDCPF